MTSVVIGESVSQIAWDAFRDCIELKTVTFKGTKVLRINDYAFKGTKIESIEIPSTVEYIGDAAFSSGTLKSITFKGDKQPAFCSTIAFKTELNPTLNLSSNYAQQEFCGISTGKGKYPDLPQNCKEL